jgi:hypothetical protein
MHLQTSKKYTKFEEFDRDYGFSEKAGFTLSKLQIQDIEDFVQWERSLNRYEVGGGKTVVSTAVSLMRNEQVTIVTVPPILIRPWVRWLQKVSSGKVIQYEKIGRKKLREELKTARWIVCSHAVFRLDFKYLKELESSVTSLGIIVDEAHWLKNIESKLYQRTVELAGFGDDRYIQMLTGTPTSKPMDCFAYIKIKTPKLYRTFSHFENVHVAKRDPYKRPVGFKNIEMLSNNFAFRSIKRTKEELHGYNLKPLYPDTSYELSPAHQALYEKLIDEQLLLLPDGSKIDATTQQRLYYACQQIILNYSQFSGNPEDRPAGYDLLDNVIEQTECDQKGKSKLIVWTLYKATSRNVWNYLLGKGIKTVAAYSEVKSQDSFDLFMEDEDTRILVAQYQSAGAGLNPQSVCWESLALETSVVPLYAIQANGRIDRMGQKHVPTIRMAVAENTIQVGLFQQLMKNDDLVAQVEGNKTRLRDLLLGRL